MLIDNYDNELQQEIYKLPSLFLKSDNKIIDHDNEIAIMSRFILMWRAFSFGSTILKHC